ncbi:pyridoxamine 5'-phosphate oxidase [Rubritalea marina]|uniref:pyridoxamine 5'-phosphate oxidase n=1 Tax=Rubritalea marina TaxID=361055 RepID=UPI00037DD267|nr:pyridoxamine 5'-phosphate oxidase [Rubritalea marina]
MDLSEYRKDYLKDGLTRANAMEDPLKQFEHWFQQAVDADYPEPNAMSLATVDTNMQPSIRTVLLKHFSAEGFVFFTNYQSRKAQDIEANPQVSILFPWITLERQVIIKGHVEKISREESEQYFKSRPHSSQLGAWVSNQSSVVLNREFLATKLDELDKEFKPGEVPLPEFWGGYRIKPESFEFWQGGPGRLHDRLYYSPAPNNSGEWSIERLSP